VRILYSSILQFPRPEPPRLAAKSIPFFLSNTPFPARFSMDLKPFLEASQTILPVVPPSVPAPPRSSSDEEIFFLAFHGELFLSSLSLAPTFSHSPTYVETASKKGSTLILLSSTRVKFLRAEEYIAFSFQRLFLFPLHPGPLFFSCVC